MKHLVQVLRKALSSFRHHLPYRPADGGPAPRCAEWGAPYFRVGVAPPTQRKDSRMGPIGGTPAMGPIGMGGKVCLGPVLLHSPSYGWMGPNRGGLKRSEPNYRLSFALCPVAFFRIRLPLYFRSVTRLVAANASPVSRTRYKPLGRPSASIDTCMFILAVTLPMKRSRMRRPSTS